MIEAIADVRIIPLGNAENEIRYTHNKYTKIYITESYPFSTSISSLLCETFIVIEPIWTMSVNVAIPFSSVPVNGLSLSFFNAFLRIDAS